jgi:hypothetical protein
VQYFVVTIDDGRRGREAVVDPEITHREVVLCIASGEYRNISFIHEVIDQPLEDILTEAVDEIPASGVNSQGRPVRSRLRPAQA